MLSLKKKSKHRKGSSGFFRGVSGSVGDKDDTRVVMLCDDIPSEESSWDSGRGSHSSGARSGSEERNQRRRSQSFQEKGRMAPSLSRSSRPTKQYSVRDVRHVDPATTVYGQIAGHSTLRIRKPYEFQSALVSSRYVFENLTLEVKKIKTV